MSYKNLIVNPSLFPSMVVVSVNNVCNYKCIHCYYPEYSKNPEYEKRYLSSEIFMKIAREISMFSESTLRLIAWGEPLLHPEIETFINIMRSEAPRNKVTLITNGSLLTADRAMAIMEGGLDLIEISTDAFREESYAQKRCSNIHNAFDKLEKNITTMVALRDKHEFNTKIVLSYILWPDGESQKELESFCNKWRHIVDDIAIRPLHTFMESIEVPADGITNDFDDRPPCYSLWGRCHINPWGEISVCYNDWDRKNVLANYESENVSIAAVWQSIAIKELRDGQVRGRFSGCCTNCKDFNPNAWDNPYENLIERLL